MKTPEQQILALQDEMALFSPGERVAAAVSGGADSMALLFALHRLSGQLGITLLAAHFHHGLRGAEADRDAAFVQKCCAAWGIAFTLGRGDVRSRAASTGEGPEAAGRALRYAFLESLPVDKIATAHTANDNAETVLIHLLRGTGTRGFAGIPVKRGRIVRPLLRCTREELEAYLAAEQIPHVEDASNQTDDYLRNRLRHRVLPLLMEENPAFLQTLSRSCAVVREEDALLSSLAAEAEARCRIENGWSCSALCRVPAVLRRRVLLSMLRSLPLSHSSLRCVTQLEALLSAPRPSACLTLPEGFLARRVYDRLILERSAAPARLPETAAGCPETPLKLPGVTPLPSLGLQIRADVTENSNFSEKKQCTFALRCDMIAAAPWSVRTRRSGDTLLLPAGHKTLKRLMIDRRIPAQERDRLPVVLCGGRIAAVLGLAADEAFRVRPGEPALILTAEPLDPPAQNE